MPIENNSQRVLYERHFLYEATNILKMEMLDDTEVYKVNKINHIIQRCGGIPLMLKLVARALRVTVQTRS